MSGASFPLSRVFVKYQVSPHLQAQVNHDVGGDSMVIINNCGKVNDPVTKDVVPEREGERGCVSSRDKAFECSLWVMHVNSLENEHFLHE